MAQAYTKDFLIAAYLSRFINAAVATVEQIESLENLAIKFYDEVGKDKFRTYASLDADALKKYKSTL